MPDFSPSRSSVQALVSDIVSAELRACAKLLAAMDVPAADAGALAQAYQRAARRASRLIDRHGHLPCVAALAASHPVLAELVDNARFAPSQGEAAQVCRDLLARLMVVTPRPGRARRRASSTR